ncbi:hypothetical protein SCALM49S_05774 [Streptomyces californicus]
MLTRIEVHGFKNLLDLSIDFGPFTCIAGENGTGKSNVFDAIQFLSLLADQSMMEAAQEVRGVHGERHGDPRDLFWKGFDLAVVQRDADRGPAQDRRDEIEKAVEAEWPGLRHVAVVPVRMLEAWLLLDEACLRHVAEHPRGRIGLDLPKGGAAENIADPKQLLKDSLARASEYKGRRLAQFQKRFSQHRLRMLELLDPEGPVACLPSRRAFVEDLDAAFEVLNG